MNSSELKRRTVRELAAEAVAQGIQGTAELRRAELVVALLELAARRGGDLTGDGVLEIMPDGFGFLRTPHLGYLPGADDVYVSPSQIRRFDLRTGDTVAGVVRPPKEGERFVALLKVNEINGRAPEGRPPAVDFTELEIGAPSRWLELGGAGGCALMRALDLLAPLPAGGRVLVTGPDGSGRTAVMTGMAAALTARHRDLAVHLLFTDQPREDLVDWVAALPAAEVVGTGLDEPAARHAQVADLCLARAERLAEGGRHVVLIVDSLTRLGRAQHAALPSRALGTVDGAVLQRLRRLFAAGRALVDRGSLTVIAAARTGGSALDEAVLEAVAPAASVVVALEPHLAAAGLVPLDAAGSHARRADRYVTAEHLAAAQRLRADLAARPPIEAAERLASLLNAPSTAAGVGVPAPGG